MMVQSFTNRRQNADPPPLANEHMQTLTEPEDNMLVIVLAAMIGSSLRQQGAHWFSNQPQPDAKDIDHM